MICRLLLTCCGLVPALLTASPFSTPLDQIEFDEAPLSEVIDFLRSKSVGINILIDPAIDLKTPVSLHLSELSVGASIICLVEQASLDYRIDQHAVFILPPGMGELAKRLPQEIVATANYRPVQQSRDLILPRVEFDDAPLIEVIRYLAERQRSERPAEEGLNLVVNGWIDHQMPISLDLTNVSIATVLGQLSRGTSLEVRAEPYAIFLDPPYTRLIQQARAEEIARLAKKGPSVRFKKKEFDRVLSRRIPDDPRSRDHPAYIGSSHPDPAKRTNSLNNSYKWVGGKWTFVRYGGDQAKGGSLEPASLRD